MKPHTARPAAPTAAIRRQILDQLTQAGFALRLAHRLPEALAIVQHTPGLLVILDLMDAEAGQRLVEDLRATEDGDQQHGLLISPVERELPERQLLQ